ncbi:MAG: HK97 family phage prohead protease [Mesorhizobium sp.]
MTNGTMSWARKRAFADGGATARRLAPAEGEGLRIAGHASLFRVADLSRDVVEPGAFSAALARRGADGIRMLFQHDPARPVGVWESLREDARGLAVRGRLTAGASGELAALIADGAIDGLSIGFRTVRARTDPRTRLRHILEADLWEISIVTFPMLPGARLSPLPSGASAMATDDTARAAAHLAARIRTETRIINGKERA